MLSWHSHNEPHERRVTSSDAPLQPLPRLADASRLELEACSLFDSGVRKLDPEAFDGALALGWNPWLHMAFHLCGATPSPQSLMLSSPASARFWLSRRPQDSWLLAPTPLLLPPASTSDPRANAAVSAWRRAPADSRDAILPALPPDFLPRQSTLAASVDAILLLATSLSGECSFALLEASPLGQALLSDPLSRAALCEAQQRAFLVSLSESWAASTRRDADASRRRALVARGQAELALKNSGGPDAPPPSKIVALVRDAWTRYALLALAADDAVAFALAAECIPELFRSELPPRTPFPSGFRVLLDASAPPPPLDGPWNRPRAFAEAVRTFNRSSLHHALRGHSTSFDASALRDGAAKAASALFGPAEAPFPWLEAAAALDKPAMVPAVVDACGPSDYPVVFVDRPRFASPPAGSHLRAQNALEALAASGSSDPAAADKIRADLALRLAGAQAAAADPSVPKPLRDILAGLAPDPAEIAALDPWPRSAVLRALAGRSFTYPASVPFDRAGSLLLAGAAPLFLSEAIRFGALPPGSLFKAVKAMSEAGFHVAQRQSDGPLLEQDELALHLASAPVRAPGLAGSL